MLPIHIGTHTFGALPQRALLWPAQRMLLLADLHLGKTDTFRHFGIAVPQTLQNQDLLRLQQLVQLHGIRRCVVLGDFVHGRIVSASTCQRWNTLVAAHPHTQFELVLGNHDRAFQPGQLAVHDVVQALQIDGVWLSHEPLPLPTLQYPGALNIHGHIHPAVRVDGLRKKLPALVHQPPYLNLPAFSEFTAGVVPPHTSQSIWAMVEDEQTVLPWK